ncbi:MAG: DUF4397 domain-containing protein [Chloroflexi bacterium]|nr:DUF4397 domain-containing protein [Chloroflexota bacterium]MCC6893555.1 DUF4397 domain-containing protein [Anaerolineae bacterium]
MRRYYRTFLWTFVLLLITACGQSNVPLPTMAPTLEPTATFIPTSTPQPVTNETLEQARPALIRIVNTVVDSPPVNVFAGFSAIATNLAYQQFTEPTSFEAGDYEIKIQASGAAQSDAPLLDSTLNFPSGQRIMILITGSADQLALTVVPDTLAPLQSDESIIHLVNALSDERAVTLRSAENDLTPAVGVGRDAFSAIIPAAETGFTFQIGDRATEYTADLQPQANTTFVVAGTASAPAIIAFDASAPNRIAVHALNAAAEVPGVDVYLDDQLLNSQVEYGRMTERQNFASGQYTVRVYAAGADRSTGEPLTGGVVTLQDGENFAVVLLGTASNLQVLSYAENLAPAEANNLRLSLLNTLPNFEEVDVQTPTKPIRGIPTLFYGRPPTVMDVEAGSYNFLMSGVDGQNQRVTTELAENVQLEAGNSYLYLVTGRQDSKPIILSEKIETVAPIPEGVEPLSGDGSTLRFINTVEGQTLDFTLNGAPALTGLNTGEGSQPLPVTTANATIAVNAAGQTTTLGQQETTFDTDSAYTVVAYTTANREIGLLVLNDADLIFDGSSPHIRFINATTNEDLPLGLAVSVPNEDSAPEQPEAAAIEEATQDPNQPAIIYTLPIGVEKLVNELLPGSASSVILMANGTYEMNIINAANNQMLLTLPAVLFSGDMHLDVVAYQPGSSGGVKAFVVEYPRPPA